MSISTTFCPHTLLRMPKREILRQESSFLFGTLEHGTRYLFCSLGLCQFNYYSRCGGSVNRLVVDRDLRVEAGQDGSSF
jgi:hypothetical protein